MKPQHYILVILSVLFSFSAVQETWGQVPDSCLVMVYPDEKIQDGYYNPDSVLKDTCACHYDELMKRCLYAKGTYYFAMAYDIFKIPKAPKDSIIERVWQDLDTTNCKNLVVYALFFQRMEEKFGKFYIRKDNPSILDTLPCGFYLRFTKYNSVDSVKSFIDRSLLSDFALLENFGKWLGPDYVEYNFFMNHSNDCIAIQKGHNLDLSKLLEIDAQFFIYNSMGQLLYKSKESEYYFNSDILENGLYIFRNSKFTSRILIY